MSEQPASADHAWQQAEPAAADAVRACGAKTRASADQFAAILEGIAENRADPATRRAPAAPVGRRG